MSALISGVLNSIHTRSVDSLFGDLVDYAENYCWAQDTYFVPMGQAVAGMADSDRRQRRISYYQVIY
uniref:Transposase n=1 Tax=Heterorhabditis bacteriophora TaxID=37862 RepID=A0A1I7XLE9_HETBA